MSLILDTDDHTMQQEKVLATNVVVVVMGDIVLG